MQCRNLVLSLLLRQHLPISFYLLHPNVLLCTPLFSDSSLCLSECSFPGLSCVMFSVGHVVLGYDVAYMVPCSIGPVSIELRWALRVIHCKEETLSHSGTMTVAMLMWPLLTATFCMPFPLMFILACAKSHFIPWGDVLYSASCTAVKQLQHRVSHIYIGNSFATLLNIS